MRIEGSYVGHASWSQQYAIGFALCVTCNRETPPPPQSVADELARKQSTITTIWPFEHWTVPGWTNVENYGRVCDRCSRAMLHMFAARAGATRIIHDDVFLLEENQRAALALVQEGLKTEFPLPALCRKTHSFDAYPYTSVDGKRGYMSHDHYKIGELRHRIREIEAALLGKKVE